MPQAHVLVVDDEPDIRSLLKDVLEDEGYRVLLAESVAAARGALAAGRPDLMLLDIWLPDADGISLLRELGTDGRPDFPVVMISGHGTIETAVEATRLGAYDFIEKPIGLAKLLLTVGRALESATLKRENERLRQHVPERGEPVGQSAAIQSLRQSLTRAAATDAAVLISGAPGTGKETLARWLHELSGRRDRPFVAVHAGALGANADEQLFGRERDERVQYGLLDQAEGGTLFLEACELLPPASQRALASALESRRWLRVGGIAPIELSARIVAAGVDPAAALAAGTLDESLYYRLGVVTLAAPSLAERSEDLPALLEHYAERYARRDGLTYRRFSSAAQHRLRRHAWPGNQRELANLVQRLMILGGADDVDAEEVERALGQAPARAAATPGAFAVDLEQPLREARESFEREYLTRLLRDCQGSVSKLAQRSGMERTHLYRKLKELGIEPRGGVRAAKTE